MNIMRQSVALSLLLLSYISFAEKRRVLTVLLFICALGFHFSSLMLIPFYFICKYNFKKRVVVFLLAITFFIGFFSPYWLSIDAISHFFPALEGAAEMGLEKLSNYEDKSALNAFGLITSMLPINILCFLLIPSENDEKSYKYLFNFYFIGTIISNIIYCAIPFGFRYSYPFFVVESVLFAYKYKYDKRVRFFLVFIIIYYLYYLVSVSLSTKPNLMIPYKINPLFDIL